MDDLNVDVRDIAKFMNIAEKQKTFSGERKQEFVLNALQTVIPSDVFEKYQDVIIFLIRALCSLTKSDIKLGINKSKFCLSKLCIS